MTNDSESKMGIPRRFRIGTALIATAMLAVVLSTLKMLDVPPGGIVSVLIFVSVIAACQVLLFGERNPRAASIVGGGGIVYLAMVVASLIGEDSPRDFTRAMTFSLSGAVIVLCVGGILGYTVGGLLAAIFQICSRVIPVEVDTLATDSDGRTDQSENGTGKASPQDFTTPHDQALTRDAQHSRRVRHPCQIALNVGQRSNI